MGSRVQQFVCVAAEAEDLEVILEPLRARAWWAIQKQPKVAAELPPKHCQVVLLDPTLDSASKARVVRSCVESKQAPLLNAIFAEEEFTDPRRLFKNLAYFYTERQYSVFDFVPTTFVVTKDNFSDDFQRFQNRFSAIEDGDLSLERMPAKQCIRNLWIVKPIGHRFGEGLRVFESLTKLKKYAEGCESGVFIQKYLERPLTLMGRKIDLRFFALVTSQPTVLLFEHGYCQTACKKLSLSISKSRGQNHDSTHITSRRAQSGSKFFGQQEEGNVIYLDDLQSYMAWKSIGPENAVSNVIMPQVKQLVLDASLAALQSSDTSDSAVKQFTLLEFNFLVDEDLRVWLVGVSSAPDLVPHTANHEELLLLMGQHLVELTIDAVLPPPKGRPDIPSERKLTEAGKGHPCCGPAFKAPLQGLLDPQPLILSSDNSFHTLYQADPAGKKKNSGKFSKSTPRAVIKMARNEKFPAGVGPRKRRDEADVLGTKGIGAPHYMPVPPSGPWSPFVDTTAIDAAEEDDDDDSDPEEEELHKEEMERKRLKAEEKSVEQKEESEENKLKALSDLELIHAAGPSKLNSQNKKYEEELERVTAKLNELMSMQQNSANTELPPGTTNDSVHSTEHSSQLHHDTALSTEIEQLRQQQLELEFAQEDGMAKALQEKNDAIALLTRQIEELKSHPALAKGGPNSSENRRNESKSEEKVTPEHAKELRELEEGHQQSATSSVTPDGSQLTRLLELQQSLQAEREALLERESKKKEINLEKVVRSIKDVADEQQRMEIKRRTSGLSQEDEAKLQRLSANMSLLRQRRMTLQNLSAMRHRIELETSKATHDTATPPGALPKRSHSISFSSDFIMSRGSFSESPHLEGGQGLHAPDLKQHARPHSSSQPSQLFSDAVSHLDLNLPYQPILAKASAEEALSSDNGDDRELHGAAADADQQEEEEENSQERDRGSPIAQISSAGWLDQQDSHEPFPQTAASTPTSSSWRTKSLDDGGGGRHSYDDADRSSQGSWEGNSYESCSEEAEAEVVEEAGQPSTPKESPLAKARGLWTFMETEYEDEEGGNAARTRRGSSFAADSAVISRVTISQPRTSRLDEGHFEEAQEDQEDHSAKEDERGEDEEERENALPGSEGDVDNEGSASGDEAAVELPKPWCRKLSALPPSRSSSSSPLAEDVSPAVPLHTTALQADQVLLAEYQPQPSLPSPLHAKSQGKSTPSVLGDSVMANYSRSDSPVPTSVATTLNSATTHTSSQPFATLQTSHELPWKQSADPSRSVTGSPRRGESNVSDLLVAESALETQDTSLNDFYEFLCSSSEPRHSPTASAGVSSLASLLSPSQTREASSQAAGYTSWQSVLRQSRHASRSPRAGHSAKFSGLPLSLEEYRSRHSEMAERQRGSSRLPPPQSPTAAPAEDVLQVYQPVSPTWREKFQLSPELPPENSLMEERRAGFPSPSNRQSPIARSPTGSGRSRFASSSVDFMDLPSEWPDLVAPEADGSGVVAEAVNKIEERINTSQTHTVTGRSTAMKHSQQLMISYAQYSKGPSASRPPWHTQPTFLSTALTVDTEDKQGQGGSRSPERSIRSGKTSLHSLSTSLSMSPLVSTLGPPGSSQPSPINIRSLSAMARNRAEREIRVIVAEEDGRHVFECNGQDFPSFLEAFASILLDLTSASVGEGRQSRVKAPPARVPKVEPSFLAWVQYQAPTAFPANTKIPIIDDIAPIVCYVNITTRQADWSPPNMWREEANEDGTPVVVEDFDPPSDGVWVPCLDESGNLYYSNPTLGLSRWAL